MPSAKKSIAELLDNRRPVVTERANIASPQGERFNADAKYVELSRIKPNPNQPRRHFDTEAMDELAASIRQDGVLQPIVVRPVHDGYQIIMGERRYRASLLAGMAEVPVIVRGMDDEEAFLAALVENLQRANLDPADEAEAYQGLLNKGYSTHQLAARVGVAQSKISRAVRVYQDPVLSQAVSDGQIRKSEAEELLVLPNEERPRLVQFIAGRRKNREPVKMTELRSEVKASNPRMSYSHASPDLPTTDANRIAPGGSSTNANRITDSSNCSNIPSVRTGDSRGSEVETIASYYAKIEEALDAHPLLAWEPVIAQARAATEGIAERVSGRPHTDALVCAADARRWVHRLRREMETFDVATGPLSEDQESMADLAAIAAIVKRKLTPSHIEPKSGFRSLRMGDSRIE